MAPNFFLSGFHLNRRAPAPVTASHPPSPTPSDQTFVMSSSPARSRPPESYKPKIISTVGQRPACLVSASVTYVGNNEIYAFGGFDQYTDEVYNHVLRLNIETKQWNLVDNYGDIPGVRMGHTATLWKGEKVLIFGGENEHRAYLNDLIIFDLKTAYWHQPDLNGITPKGRARHSAVIHDDKLFIIGGLSGTDNSTILDDMCYLDLKTFTWSRTWRFVPRFDHTCWLWGGRLWVFGGLTEGMERASDIWWLDMKQSPIFNSEMATGNQTRPSTSAARSPRPTMAGASTLGGASTGYAANSSSVQVAQASSGAARRPPRAPGSISSMTFHSGPNIPMQSVGTHFHAYSSGCLLDFVTPAVTGNYETSLCALDFETMRWEKLADGRDLFNANYRWHYCALNQEGTHAWLLGCPIDPPPSNAGQNGEYLSDVLSIDLRKLGLLGNDLAVDSRGSTRLPMSDATSSSFLSGIGADLARTFDNPNSGTDFTVTAEPDDAIECDEEEKTGVDSMQDVSTVERTASKPIHVHRLILESRWPHFHRMISTQMSEYHTRKLHIPDPYPVVRAFLYYLYTDSIARQDGLGPFLDDVAGMLVMSNLYDMPRLKALCRNRLGRELDVKHAATIWEKAGVASEEWLKKRAARFCMVHWGRIVQTNGFQNLPRASLVELCREVDVEGRVLGAEELEIVGGLGGAKFGSGPYVREARSRTPGGATHHLEEGEEGDDDENMDF
ncbi:MAG: hypothetical protein Q9162_002403 [Coniocarpon cinnabarinum]